MFAGKVLLSIASAVRKPLAIDKAIQIRSRPSLVQPSLEANNVEQLKGDAIAFLNAKRDGNQMAEVSSTKELASTNLNVFKVMENATAEVNNNATNLINESIVELGQQLSQNRGVTRNWTLVAYKNSAGRHIRSSASQSNSPERENGDIGNFQLRVDPKFTNSECF
ncbi:hypothetical protein MTR67_007699 [Solanum verrucosum]|uniref:Uncharacterized protein n=1 Tax=Solanum verrucosum TaxID=315347 RepID=A0AAF0Q6K8_SOLVR|nr:hypothetical protein MTR67_007699 [Solanum verrucosum]